MVFQLQKPPMAAITSLCSVPLLLHPLSFCTHINPQHTHCRCINLCLPFSASKFNPPSIRASRSRFSGPAGVAPRLAGRVCRVRGLVGDDSLNSPEPESKNSQEGASIDSNLPRRSLLVQFTCDLCGERTNRLVNRLAYERGAVFVQCAGCLRHHKLVDNLGLITEYDFREKMNVDSEIDEI